MHEAVMMSSCERSGRVGCRTNRVLYDFDIWYMKISFRMSIENTPMPGDGGQITFDILTSYIEISI